MAVVPTYKVIFELQSVSAGELDKAPKTSPAGWTCVDLFTPAGELNAGLWKLPMFHPPVRPDINLKMLSRMPRIPKMVHPLARQ